MTDEKELTPEEYVKMMTTFNCPECEGGICIPRPDGKGNRQPPFCGKCGTSFVIKKKEVEVTEVKVKAGSFVKQRELIAVKCGGSAYEPMKITVYCENCRKKAAKKLEKDNTYEKVNGMKETEATGFEGINSLTVVITKAINVDDGKRFFYANCGCGRRYKVLIEFNKVLRKDNPVFCCKLGFHDECIKCEHSFDVGIERNEFLFRCDDFSNCNKIDKKDFKRYFY